MQEDDGTKSTRDTDEGAQAAAAAFDTNKWAKARGAFVNRVLMTEEKPHVYG